MRGRWRWLAAEIFSEQETGGRRQAREASAILSGGDGTTRRSGACNSSLHLGSSILQLMLRRPSAMAAETLVQVESEPLLVKQSSSSQSQSRTLLLAELDPWRRTLFRSEHLRAAAEPLSTPICTRSPPFHPCPRVTPPPVGLAPHTFADRSARQTTTSG